LLQPSIEVADIIRAAGSAFFEGRHRWLTSLHVRVLLAILRCRTSLLGGHVDACLQCGYQAVSYNSCRNRHCPKCQTNARDHWLHARRRDLLPTRFVHVVFTLPHQLAPLALQNKRQIYGLLFRSSADTLLEVARDPRHLGRYTHGVAISNHRLVSLDAGLVTFRWRDSAHKNKQRLMALTVDEFLRRFLLHVLPPGFVRIRYFGIFAHRQRSLILPLCFQLLTTSSVPRPTSLDTVRPLWRCPNCGGSMVVLERLSSIDLRLRSPPVIGSQHQ
jgi:predicted RNA-binding Zn-ribbon protein involved in translation (DUF1610 family)